MEVEVTIIRSLEETDPERAKLHAEMLKKYPDGMFMYDLPGRPPQLPFPGKVAKNARLGTWKSRKEIMEQDNKNAPPKNKDYYAITLFDNDGNLKHVILDVQLRVKHPPCFSGNPTVNTINICKVGAIVDTGATVCAITKRKARELGLIPTGEYPFTSTGGRGLFAMYVLDVIFPKGKVFENIEVSEMSDDEECDFLIGMNIISQGDMALTRVDGIAAFSFRVPPAGKYIEFEKEAP